MRRGKAKTKSHNRADHSGAKYFSESWAKMCSETPEQGHTHKLQGERNRTGATSVGIQDISNQNILREGRI
jgi:hypothetical protein